MEIDVTQKNTYYNYNGIDFYYRKKTNDDKLLVNFHGFIRRTIPLPVFRGYNWNYNVLCISDNMLQQHPDMSLGWYCTENGSNIDQTYKEIINFFMSNHNNIVFHGSSGGGMPSLLYAAYFHKKAYIANAQLYLDEYGHYETFRQNVDDLNLTEPVHADKIIDKYGLPSMMYVHVNMRDNHHYKKHYIPFMKYVNDRKLNANFRFVAFNGVDPTGEQTHHTINTPPNITSQQIIDELFLQTHVTPFLFENTHSGAFSRNAGTACLVSAKSNGSMRIFNAQRCKKKDREKFVVRTPTKMKLAKPIRRGRFAMMFDSR
jgi:hypothetical protein